MIKGMTGFGNAQVATGNVKAVIEIKSLNHRYLDINYYLPIGFGSIEDKIRLLVQKQVQRGRVTVSIKILQKPSQAVELNKEVVRKHLRYANQIRKEFKLKNDLSLSDVIRLPGVLEVRDSHINADKLWPDLQKGLSKSLTGLVQMRKREGKSLQKDVADKLKRMSIQLKKIQARSKAVLRDQKKVLGIDEYKAFQKSCDINEEISRLQHYIVELTKLLKSTVSVGKKIDFIAQEMQRETNTIGSKLQDKIVSNSVIALKSKIEKIREQAQNVE